MHHHVRVPEGRAQGAGVTHVALAVVHLRPAAPGRVERTPGDADHPRHAVVGLEQREEPGPEGPGRPRDRDGQIFLSVAHATGGIILGG